MTKQKEQKGGNILISALGTNGLTGLGVPAALVLARDFLSKKRRKSKTRKNKQKGGIRRYPGTGGRKKMNKTKTRKRRYPGVGGGRKKMHHVSAGGAVAALMSANQYLKRKNK